MDSSLQNKPSQHPLAGGPPAPRVRGTSPDRPDRTVLTGRTGSAAAPGPAGAFEPAGAVAPSDPPWRSLPPELAELLAPVVPAVVGQIIETVPREIPAYQTARTERFIEVLRLGVHGALEQLLSLPGTEHPALDEESRELVASLGAGEFRQGRSMDALLAAYRASARVTFRGLSEACADLGLPMEVVVDLGETILAYIDELSAVSVQAYAVEQSAHAGALQLRRATLITTLVRGGAELSEVHRLAAAADWRLPHRMAAVVLPLSSASTVRTRLGASGVVVERESDATALVAAPAGGRFRPRMEEVFAGVPAVLGPPVDWDAVPHSHRVAQAVASWRGGTGTGPGTGPAGGTGPVFASDRLADIILGSEALVMADLAARRLAPLAGLSPAKREALEETLLLWLQHWGQRAPVARALGIHAQTVGYRVARLRELFGGELEDPRVRFELELVLRAREGA